MIDVAEAWKRIAATPLPGGEERCSLPEAQGRVLAEDLLADRDFPPFDRVAMDGIALKASEVLDGGRVFRNAGCQAAGRPRRNHPLERGSCLEVMTGAVLPRDCDTVIPYEQIEAEGGGFRLVQPEAVRPWRHVHRQGSDRQEGSVLLEKGVLLRSPEIAVAATIGKLAMQVACRPRLLVLSTGDELVPVSHTPQSHQIRQSNGPALVAALRRAGHPTPEPRHLGDEVDLLRRGMAEALHETDILILSGGVSRGKFDYVPALIEQLGVHCVFHRVRQRPGQPLWFGRSDEGKVVFGLPGNPVSALVGLHRYILPWITPGGADHGMDFLPLAEPFEFKPDLCCFLPVKVEVGEDGARSVLPRPTAGSGDLAGLCDSDGFIELPQGRQEYPAGFKAAYRPWS